MIPAMSQLVVAPLASGFPAASVTPPDGVNVATYIPAGAVIVNRLVRFQVMLFNVFTVCDPLRIFPPPSRVRVKFDNVSVPTTSLNVHRILGVCVTRGLGATGLALTVGATVSMVRFSVGESSDSP